jgi:hypothetical protein
MLRLWQELQEMKPDLDSRGSKNSFLPSSALAKLTCRTGGTGWIGSSAQAFPHKTAARTTAETTHFLAIIIFPPVFDCEALGLIPRRLRRNSKAFFINQYPAPWGGVVNFKKQRLWHIHQE